MDAVVQCASDFQKTMTGNVHSQGLAPTDAIEPTNIVEGPDAPAIRKQVEFYFSDENLRTDLHLLQCCSGRENLPVSVSRICGFRKMRKYKKAAVVAALRNSTFLDVVENGKRIIRKKPLEGPCLLDEDFAAEFNGLMPGKGAPIAAEDDIAYDPRSKRAIQHPVPSQQKKVLPPGMTKNMLKPTGFENSYVEGPLRPEEAAEEMAMYDPDKAFVERIEIAIQRFKQKRRMHEMYSKIFDKWMKYGGVEQAPRMFGGLDQAAMKEMSAEEIARATATHHVNWDREDPSKWVVDFAGVGEGFLSSFYPQHYGHNPNEVKTACQVLRSFYQYLLFHDVCNEYRDDLLAARLLCNKAEKELPQVYAAACALPGAFNVAASTIFNGYYCNAYIGASDWAADLTPEERGDYSSFGMSDDIAKVLFSAAVTVYGSEAQQKALTNRSLDELRTEHSKTNFKNVNLEIIDIRPPTEEVKQASAFRNREVHREDVDVSPLGKLICKTCQLSDFDCREYDLPAGQLAPSHTSGDESTQYEFWMEEDALQACFVGMKMSATVFTINGGIRILDAVRDTYCSFYKFLPNDLHEARKPPKFRKRNKGLEDVMEAEEAEAEGQYGAMEAQEVGSEK